MQNENSVSTQLNIFLVFIGTMFQGLDAAVIDTYLGIALKITSFISFLIFCLINHEAIIENIQKILTKKK